MLKKNKALKENSKWSVSSRWCWFFTRFLASFRMKILHLPVFLKINKMLYLRKLDIFSWCRKFFFLKILLLLLLFTFFSICLCSVDIIFLRFVIVFCVFFFVTSLNTFDLLQNCIQSFCFVVVRLFYYCLNYFI